MSNTELENNISDAELELEFEHYFGGVNDISRYLKPVTGKRFAIITKQTDLIEVSDRPDDFVGLYDLNFLGNGDIMCNSKLEKRHNIEFLRKAKGDVLTTGLGMGFILVPLINKPEVTSIDVVELQQEVIDLVAPMLPLNDKVKIIKSNIMDFVPTHDYDCMYFDTLYEGMLLPDEIKARTVNGEYILDKDLGSRFSQFLKPGGYSSAWELPEPGESRD